ncbi:MAG: hypothetical protein HZB16_02275 [Armatimonadetes bacterium]|nr:hypothetical protein [Armatimonadota bacterium]
MALLREHGRMDEAEALEAEPQPPTAATAPEPTPQPEPSAPRPAAPLVPGWMVGVAAVGVVCVLVALLLPWWLGRHQARAETRCRERLQRVSFALRLAVDAADGYYPPVGTDLARLLATYQIQAADLRCPSGAVYRLNPMLAGRRQEDVVTLPSTALLVETSADGRPATPHRGRCLGVLANGWVGELDSVARGSVTASLPVSAAPEAPSTRPAWPQPAPSAPPAPVVAPVATANGPTPEPPPAPRRAGSPRDIPPTEPERPGARQTGAAPRVTTRPASAPQVLSGDSAPPETKAWQTVLTMEGHDLATSQPFAVGEQSRVRFETHCNELGPQPFRLLLVDEVGARPLRVLAVGVGPSSGAAEIGAAGRFRVRVISVQPYKVSIEDRR